MKVHKVAMWFEGSFTFFFANFFFFFFETPLQNCFVFYRNLHLGDQALKTHQ